MKINYNPTNELKSQLNQIGLQDCQLIKIDYNPIFLQIVIDFYRINFSLEYIPPNYLGQSKSSEGDTLFP